MADDRQHKLAAARRKLKEFQQKTPPAPVGGKKKKKGKESNSHPDTPNRLSPDPIEAILKGLVSDLHRSNGVSIPGLGDMKQNEYDGTKMAADGKRFVSSTDSLRQLSEQLNGLVSQGNSYVNGENIISSASPELEARSQDLAAALDSSNLTNKQLSTKLEELKQQNQDVLDQLDKERKDFEQKLSKEQGSLREQLQVHIQTIGILVSEKSELQTALSYTQQAARQKGAEVEDLVMRLQSTRQRVTELERTLSSISTQQKQLEKLNKELEKERDSLRLESLKNSKSSDELKQQNSELSEKLNALLSENASMRLDLGDLHKKLEMAELMIQQFSNQTGAPDMNKQLQMVIEERDQLGTQLTQMSDSLQQLKAERDQYVQKLKEEGAVWQERVRQLSEQIQTVSQEKESALVQVEQLETRAQLMDRLQHDEVQGKVSAELHLKELQQSRVNLELLTKENQELKAQMMQIRNEPESRVLSRMEGNGCHVLFLLLLVVVLELEPTAYLCSSGDGVESKDYEDEIPKSSLVIPEDFESREEMMAFLSSALSKLQGERDEVERQLTEQKRNCKRLLQEISELRQQQMSMPPHRSAELGMDSVPREVYDALQSAMEKLQFRFTDLMQERVELKDRVEELEHRCIQLSGETDTIGEYIALYQSQRAILKQRHSEKEEYISRLAQDKEEMKAKLLELQVLVMRLVAERNEWYKKYVEVTRDSKELGQMAQSAHRPMELDMITGEALEEVSLLEDAEEEKAQRVSPLSSVQEGLNAAPSSEDPTAKQIMQLLREIQNPQERPGSLLHNPCIPFFYRVDENDEVRIMVV
ncbi:hypothetical protein GDO78_012926 [Eleutherodactylus coqui]|uniref:Golgin subfamily A conserved domain-containing protein n=1 Tax=Eleutherodactylus coqui TaxID=57060 RepID=A0A8J6EZH9_ELECQ|nr:hypothetical protein GDO78_012926 [Eleutherodactylus coqui]